MHKFLHRRKWTLVSKLDGGIHILLSTFLDCLQSLLIEVTSCLETLGERRYGVMLTPLFLDFLPIAVPVRVDYRVATEPASNSLNQPWLVLLYRPLYGIGHPLTYPPDIGAIHTPA